MHCMIIHHDCDADAEGHSVIGVFASEEAAEAYIKEHELYVPRNGGYAFATVVPADGRDMEDPIGTEDDDEVGIPHHRLPNGETILQIQDIYRRLVKEAKYAPMAPGDGMGNLNGVQNTEAESQAYVQAWWDEEQGDRYWCGVPDWGGRPALVFAIEAARNINGMNYGVAAKLLRMAADELENPQGPSFSAYTTKLGKG